MGKSPILPTRVPRDYISKQRNWRNYSNEAEWDNCCKHPVSSPEKGNTGPKSSDWEFFTCQLGKKIGPCHFGKGPVFGPQTYGSLIPAALNLSEKNYQARGKIQRSQRFVIIIMVFATKWQTWAIMRNVLCKDDGNGMIDKLLWWYTDKYIHKITTCDIGKRWFCLKVFGFVLSSCRSDKTRYNKKRSMIFRYRE